MKISALVALSLFTLYTGLFAEPREIVILSSPNLAKPEKGELFKEFQNLVVNQAAPSDHIRIFDGLSLKPVVDYTIPADAATPKSKFAAATPSIQALQKFLAGSSTEDRQLRLPQFVAIYRQLIEKQNARVLAIGSPLYHDEITANDMREGWLGDGYLTQAPQVSIFSTQNKKEQLRSAQINYCILSESLWTTENKDAHREMTQRFWSLYLQGCGGSLVSFQPSLSVGFKRLLASSNEPVGNYKINPDEKDMIIHRSKIKTLQGQIQHEEQGGQKIQEDTSEAVVIDLSRKENAWLVQEATTRTTPDPKPAPAPVPVTTPVPVPVPATIDSTPAAPTPTPEPVVIAAKPEVIVPPAPAKVPLPESGPMKIGLTWQGEGIDLDLYVRALPGAAELFYGLTSCPEGRHYKDFSNSRPLCGFELVDLTSEVRPPRVSIWVNVYKGKSDHGFSGDLRVLYDGKVKIRPFTISAREGNMGKDIQLREASPYWIRIDLKSLLEDKS